MKLMTRILALMLAVLMLAAVMAACGEKKDEGKTENGGSDTASQADNGGAAAAGSEQTWGEITVFVPDSMNMQGGDGTFDPDDQKTLWLYDNAKATNYIKVTIVDSEDDAKSSIDTTKSMNEEYNPEDTAQTINGTAWKGVKYDASGTACSSQYAVIGDKVYFIMEAGFEFDGEIMTSILESLK